MRLNPYAKVSKHFLLHIRKFSENLAAANFFGILQGAHNFFGILEGWMIRKAQVQWNEQDFFFRNRYFAFVIYTIV